MDKFDEFVRKVSIFTWYVSNNRKQLFHLIVLTGLFISGIIYEKYSEIPLGFLYGYGIFNLLNQEINR